MSRATFWADHRNSRIELSPMCRVYFRWNAEGSAPSFKKPRTRLEETFSRIVEGNFAQLRRLARSRRSQCRKDLPIPVEVVLAAIRDDVLEAIGERPSQLAARVMRSRTDAPS